ncbi:hypothetical protein ZEAMMB73_Zm00001d030093 [Zea mays]|uniref:Uncharacterized protein n=1 Tax=Zea mays TaxID=4577 RepID=A0A1D6K9H9_MAIZE|nr:hypothetical protein ZEAMMB73_Zm00001d030093 [Zea mays]
MSYKRVNTSYFVIQAMVMWGNDRRIEFDRDSKIIRRNFVIDLLSYEDNSCIYTSLQTYNRDLSISLKRIRLMYGCRYICLLLKILY